jgi:hypothetical protein
MIIEELIMTIDFSQINNSAEIEEREMILAEDNISTELSQMAEMVEAKDTTGEFEELVERAFMVAANNPLSDAALDVKAELMDALKEVR